ncbi:hypothetical protein GCM10010468_39800 [Actinocorallia longicatena]|uniref:Chemotaxis protein n=1 Tax=Actinocorallia longicatena TaxID=111803 RepID=A0ABP6QE34_9ACTN
MRLKTLLDQARHRLEGLDLERGVAEEIIDNLEKAAGQVDFEHVAEGLVLLAAPGGESHAFVLPRVSVAERVIIDDTFATRDLVAMFESTWKYWVLVLSEQPTRLWSGDGERLEEVANALFPLEFEDSLPDERGTTPTQPKQFRIQDDRRMQFFRDVERHLTEVVRQDDRPIIVLGVPRYLTYFGDLADGPVARSVIGTVEGSYDTASAPELAQLVGPVLEAEHRRVQERAVAELDGARSAKLYAGGLEETWELASQARIAHLIVEEGFFAPARAHDGRLYPADGTEGDFVNDAVDDLIEATLNGDGRVTFVPDGALAAEDRIAAVLRF